MSDNNNDQKEQQFKILPHPAKGLSSLLLELSCILPCLLELQASTH